MSLFEGFAGAHGTHGEPEFDPGKTKWHIKRTARTLREPVTLELWESHLKGKTPLGVIPIRENGTCSWGSIDVDRYDINLLDIIQRVESNKFPLVPCRSKSGGLHLFLFLKEPQQAATVLPVLKACAATLGLAGCEVFPVQTHILLERGDLGNWMVMPYFGGNYSGKLKDQSGLKKTGGEMTIEEFLRAADESRVSTADFNKMSRRELPSEPRGPIGKKALVTSGADFADGPPCLQHLASQGVPPGGQNNTLLMFGIYYKRADPQNWRARLEEANGKLLDPPGNMEALQSTVHSLEKREYLYTCKKEPMASHCNGALCRTRPLGVGEGEGKFPVITSISKLKNDPPIWFVDIEGLGRVELTTDQLQRYDLFHKESMNRHNVCYLPIKQGTWYQMVGAALENLHELDAPPDAGRKGMFREYLEDFLTNRQRGRNKEDIFLGRPWEDAEKDRHYFRLRDLMRYLEREKVRDYTRGQITRLIVEIGGDHEFMNMPIGGKQKGVNVWWVPVASLDTPPDVPTPRMEREVI